MSYKPVYKLNMIMKILKNLFIVYNIIRIVHKYKIKNVISHGIYNCFYFNLLAKIKVIKLTKFVWVILT